VREGEARFPASIVVHAREVTSFDLDLRDARPCALGGRLVLWGCVDEPTEVMSGTTVGVSHLRNLERARGALGPGAASARLLLLAPSFTTELERLAATRADVELVDHGRLHG